MRVAVTGAAGFIGREVSRLLLAKGFDVHGLGRSRPADSEPGLTCHTIDLLDTRATVAVMKSVRADALVHLAWDVTPGYWTSPANLDWVQASLGLYRAFADAGGARAVFAGTCAEYDWSGDPVLSPDRTPMRPATPYGVAKDALRRLVTDVPAGPSVAWGRIFWLYGPREPKGRLVSDVIDALASGEPAACSAGLQARDYLHVRDVAAAFVHALESDHVGTFNIGSGTAVTVRDIVSLIGRTFERPDLIRLGALPSRDEPPVLKAETTALRRMGWAPAFDLETGMADCIATRSGRGL